MERNMESNNIYLVSKYWKKKILNREKILELQQQQNSLPCITIKAQELDYFNRLTNKNVIAQYTVISAIYSFLLKKLIHEFDGYLVSNYKDQDNSLLLSFPVDLKISFKEYLQKVKLEILETLKNSDYNNALIAEKTNVNDLSLLSHYGINFNSDTKLECNGILFHVKIADTIEIHVSYLEGFVKQTIVEYLVQHLNYFIVNLEKNVAFNLSEYPLLSPKEKHQLLVDFNDTSVAYPKDKTIVDLFEEQVAKTPNNVAVVFGETKLTYSTLNEKANQLAHYISSKHIVNNGDIIGVFLPKSDTGIISLLAIVKLGAVYLPIDTNYPQERIDYLIKDSGLKLLIAKDATLAIDNCETVAVESIHFENSSSDTINKAISSEDLAYVIYTSGSTGHPKGVMVEHRSVINMALDQIRSFKISESDTIAWFASVSFDASISEILMSLYSGATLSIPTEEIIKDQDQFISFLKDTKVSVVTFPPSYLGLLTENDISGVRCIITAGESANPGKAKAIVKSGIDYYNAYGPTECAVCVSIYEVKNDFDKSIIPIGKPISNTQVYILDDALQLLPIGVTGKLYVSGAGVTRGYLNKPELTAEKFISNPFIEGSRMYDTGDFGCWLPDGTIEFLGRKDHQVKIRGYRIELGEIENAILESSENLQQVVVEVKEHHQEKVLVAYLVAKSHIDKSELRGFLQERLPDYMIPGFYVALDALPLTPNGKIDRKSLPNVEGEDFIRKTYVAPKTDIENKLAIIWQEVLGIDTIGTTDNFFELGGHSLIISQVINRIHKQLGKTVSFKIFFANPTIEGLSKQLQKNEYSAITKAPEAASYPLTASQSRLWTLSQLEGGSLAYNMPAVVKLTGIVEIHKLEESFRRLIHRHEILRTCFKTNDEGEVRQHIQAAAQVNFTITEKDYSSVENQEGEIAAYLQNKNNEPFDLEQAPLVRASLIRLKENEYLFFLSLHHIIGDGWSIEILLSEVIKTYNALTQGKAIDLPELSLHYKDYTLWLNEELHQEKQQASEQYWLQQFQGELPVLDLPSFKTRPLVKTYNGHNLTHHYSKAFLEKLKTFSKEQDVTLFMTLMAGINALLHKYTAQNDIIIGTPIAGREHPDLENQLGLYLNTLAIRTKLNEKSSFLDLVALQKETLLGAYDHQNYPFDALVGKLNLKRDTSRSALFDVLVVLQNQGQLNNLNNEELINFKISDYDFKSKTAQLDMSFTFVETEGLNLRIDYNTDIYEESLIERIFLHFENLFTASIEQPEKNIREIHYLTEKEKHQLLADFNNTAVVYPKDKTIVDLFEEQAARTPNTIAVVFEETELTYQELNESANQLANYLRENYSIKPNDLVGLKLERNEKMIVAMLGILKSGAAYVPIDIHYPEDRIAYIEKDSNSKVIIDEVAFQKFNQVQEKHSKENLEKIHATQDLAYVIYTSGTTGNPKGVMVEHSNAFELINWSDLEFDSSKFEVMYVVTSYCFDLSIYEIFYPLSIGKKIRVLKNALDIKNYIHKENKILLNTVPSVVRKLIEEKIDLNNVPFINMAGEIVPVDLVSKLQAEKAEVRNLYGPSEDTTYSTNYVIQNQEYRSIPIGKPISNTQVYILDEALQLLPIGVAGKLYVSGAGVTRGYLNKPELTAEKFISNPFMEGSRMYDTGDFGCWLPDGTIEFLGRKDHQVKIRGYRIELGEIENAILESSENLQQVVVEVKEHHQEKVLVAYLVAKNSIDKSELRGFLQERLPDYMIPGFYVALDALPLTPNGKIDRKLLPAVEGEDFIRKTYVAPKNDIENKLAIIWQEVLGIDTIGTTDNFFELGGHSLIISQVINRIHKQLGKTVSFKIFFANPTIEGLSKQLQKNEYSAIIKAPEAASYPLTASQSRLWTLSQLEGGSLAYNMPAVVKLTGIVEIHKLEESFRRLIHRHEILRTYFKTNDEGEVRQHIQAAAQVNFTITEKDYSSVENQEGEIAAYLQNKNNEPFDLEQAPLVRASLIRLKENEYLFFLSLHHIIGDGWSIEILLSEVIKTYNALTQGKAIDLPELSLHYKDYTLWLNEQLNQEKQQASEQYWLQQFQGELPVLDLPAFKTRPLVKTYNGHNLTHHYSKAFLEQLKTFSKEQDATLFMTLMAGINALLHKYTAQNDIIIGTPIAGREHPDLENQLGLYLNTLAIRTKLKEKNSFLDLVALQKETLLGAYDHQNYPFDALVGKLNLKRDTSRSALFDVLVVLQNQGQLNNLNNEELINFKISDYDFKSKTAQLDMSFTFVETEGLNLRIDYNTDIYEESLIERIFLHFENLLTASIEQPEKNIREIHYLTEKEKHQLLADFNNTAVAYPKDKTIVDLFEEQAARTPNTIAVVFEETQITYQELNESANQLANYLRENYSIEPNDLVGLKLERNEKMIVAMLGILKSGAAYVPIDIHYPEDRIMYIEKDSNSKVIIDVAALESFSEIQEQYAKENLEKIHTTQDLAYVIYTSGTTGNPKGVMVEHRNAFELINWSDLEFDASKFEVMYAVTSYCFDLSIYEIFYPLSIGKKIRVLKNALDIKNYITKENKILLNTVPSVVRKLIEENIDLNNVSFINMAGEIVPVDIVSKLQAEKAEVRNLYGPSEDTTYSTNYVIQNQEYRSIPIGKPISNTQIYILDEALQLLPIGVTGKLYVSGAGVTRGYLNKPELTAEKFISNPFIEGSRMYDTGDFGCWLPDGTIEFLGRKDHQVKIRGYRIELGEIENAILESSENLQQVVVEVKEHHQEKVLVAYLVAKNSIDKSELRGFLQERLPDYMIPGFYVALDALPLTPNGKIDRKLLPAVEGEDFIRKTYVAPKNDIENKLAIIWREVLGIDTIGTTDNFFELGGHSLKAIKVINRIKTEIGSGIEVSDIFKYPTISSQGGRLDLAFKKVYSPIVSIPKQDFYEMSDMQKRLWIISSMEEQAVYNIPFACILSGSLNVETFNESVKRLIQRHESLRTRFVFFEGEPKQQIIAPENLEENLIHFIDLSEEFNKEEIAETLTRQELTLSFDLKKELPLRINIIKLSDNEHILNITLNHMAADGWSLKILFEELIRYYDSLVKGEDISLPPLRIQYKDYVSWKKNDEEQLAKDQKSKEFWLRQLQGELPVSNLPADYPRKSTVKNYAGGNVYLELSKELTASIEKLVITKNSTLFSFLLSVLNIAIFRYTRNQDIIVGTVVSGRDMLELEEQIGLYINTIAIRNIFDQDIDFTALYEQVHLNNLQVFEHQNYSLDSLIDELSFKNDALKTASMFNIMLAVQNFDIIKNREVEGLEIISYDGKYSEGISKYDLTLDAMVQDNNTMLINFEFNSGLFKPATIKAFSNSFIQIMEQVLRSPDIKISEINLSNTIKSEPEKVSKKISFNF
ncbi:amino acid adenylation domain-containing protein [Flavobacterium tructae]|uniref:non-ribosomal peptide synthetase n=1 Tax=Flavobacterium tructae TaxID=1114873 RepID=UPI0035A8411D